MIGARLTASEKKRLKELAVEAGLAPSQYVRRVLLESLEASQMHRLILGEICALRRQMEGLLQTVSELSDPDVERVRSAADGARAALVEARLLELRGSSDEAKDDDSRA